MFANPMRDKTKLLNQAFSGYGKAGLAMSSFFNFNLYSSSLPTPFLSFQSLM